MVEVHTAQRGQAELGLAILQEDSCTVENAESFFETSNLGLSTFLALLITLRFGDALLLQTFVVVEDGIQLGLKACAI